jgi:hypothetical protein
MTIQIDDAGWGCLLLGVLIGAYRVETGEFAFGEISVEHFQNGAFARQDYLDVAVIVADELLMQLAVGLDEPIEVCRGYVLDGVRAWLSKQGYTWTTIKVEGPLQVLVENALLQKLHALGIKVDYSTLTEKQGLLFWHCLRWLKGGDMDATRALPERETLAKTGWSSYDIWVSHPYQQAKRLAAEAKRARSRVRRPW